VSVTARQIEVESGRGGEGGTEKLLSPSPYLPISPSKSPVYELQFAVKDTGIGIPQERMERLFKPFSQVDASMTRRYGGTGLGLVISQRLSEMMGGRIWVDSEVGHGSTFYFTITAQLAPTTDVVPKYSPPQFDLHFAQELPLDILLVEDLAVNQKVALLMLQQLGYGADVASNGIEALQALDRQDYDVVLMDVQMPEMDGLETTRFITEQWSDESRPWIIAMTAHAMQGDRQECLQAGMNDYISKPLSIEAIVQALNQYKLLRGSGKWGMGSREEKEEPSSGLLPLGQSAPTPYSLLPTPCFEPEVLQTLGALAGEAGASVLEEVISSYLEDAPRRLQALTQAVMGSDAAAVQKSAHALRSLSVTIGAAPVAQLCVALEAIGRAGTTAGAQVLVKQLQAEYERLEAALLLELERGKYD